MDKIAFFYQSESSRSKYLINTLNNEFEILDVHSCEEVFSLFKKSYNNLVALIVDHPADKKDIKKVFDYIEQRNSYMFSLPVLILTSFELMNQDDKYLSQQVVGMISEGETYLTVVQRIKNTIKFSNSASFDDFSRMLKVLPSLIYLKDKDGRYAFCSQNWHHLEKPGESIRGLTDFDVRKNKENAKIAREADLKVIKTGKGSSYMIKEEDEEGVDYLQIIKEPLKNDKGEVNGIIAIINNVTTEELLRQELRHKSITDQLTGIYNRVYFQELSDKYKSNVTIPLTVISVDCDGLKKINDKFGHAAGDKYICLTKDAIQDALPEKSFLFRMGGDEFIALIPGMKAYEAAKVVKEIVKNSKKYKTSNFKLSLSAGSYTINKKGISVESAMALSDKSMYKMKKSKHR